MNQHALKRARRGAAWLDRNFGRGWRKKVKRTKLDMARGVPSWFGCGCVLTQIYGEYKGAVNFLGIEGKREGALGFDTDETVESYSDLTEAWCEVLREKAPA